MVDFKDSSTTTMAVSVSVATTECSSVVANPDTQPVKKKRNLPGMPGNRLLKI